MVGGRTTSSPSPHYRLPSFPKGPKETLPAVLKRTSGRTGAAWTAQCPVTEAHPQLPLTPVSDFGKTTHSH